MMPAIRRVMRLYQGFFVSGAIFVFGMTSLTFAVIPGIRTTKELYGTLVRTREELGALLSKRTFLEATSEEELYDTVVHLLSLVPQDKSVSTVFTTIEGLAGPMGLVIEDMSLSSPGSLATGSASRLEKTIGASSLPFTVTASGSYDQIRSFFGAVNRVRRLFDVASFDVSIGNTGITNARVSLTAFYQPLPTNVSAVGVPIKPLSETEQRTLETVGSYPDVSYASGDWLTPMVTSEKRDPFAR